MKMFLFIFPGGNLEIEIYEDKDGKLGPFMKGVTKLVFNGKMV